MCENVAEVREKVKVKNNMLNKVIKLLRYNMVTHSLKQEAGGDTVPLILLGEEAFIFWI